VLEDGSRGLSLDSVCFSGRPLAGQGGWQLAGLTVSPMRELGAKEFLIAHGGRRGLWAHCSRTTFRKALEFSRDGHLTKAISGDEAVAFIH